MSRVWQQGMVSLTTLASLSLGMASPADGATALSIEASGGTGVAVAALNGWQYTHNFWPTAADGEVTGIEVVHYPASIGISPAMPMGDSVELGKAALDEAIRSTSGKVVIVCESQGCVAVTVLLKAYEADPATAPDLTNVVFVFAGNPSAPSGVAAKMPGFVETALQITYPGKTPDWVTGYMFTREFDFFAYTPDSVIDPIVALNYAASFLTVHPYYGAIDPTALDPNTWVKTVGNTTYFVIPTDTAPVLIPFEAAFRDSVWSAEFDTLNTQMLAAIRPMYASNLEGYVQLRDLSVDQIPTGIEAAAIPVSDQNQRQTGSFKGPDHSATPGGTTEHSNGEIDLPAALELPQITANSAATEAISLSPTHQQHVAATPESDAPTTNADTLHPSAGDKGDSSAKASQTGKGSRSGRAGSRSTT